MLPLPTRLLPELIHIATHIARSLHGLARSMMLGAAILEPDGHRLVPAHARALLRLAVARKAGGGLSLSLSHQSTLERGHGIPQIGTTLALLSRLAQA